MQPGRFDVYALTDKGDVARASPTALAISPAQPPRRRDAQDNDNARGLERDDNELSGAKCDQRGRSVDPAPMFLPDGPWQPPSQWRCAVSKPGRDGGQPVWEASYARWVAEESLAKIAAHPKIGKPVKESTIRRHIEDALLFGRPVDIARLSKEASSELPNAAEWACIEEAATKHCIDPSGRCFTAKVIVDEVLLALALGPQETKAGEKRIYDCIGWWALLKRSGYPVRFCASSNKKTKMA